MSVKIVLRTKKNPITKQIDPSISFPLAIRIIKDRRASFIHLGYKATVSQWDESEQRVRKNHPNATRLNNLILAKLAGATNTSLELETERSEVSSHAIKQKIKPKGGSTFFAQAALYLSELQKAGKYNQYTADKPRIKHFKEFLQGSDITFSDVTDSLLRRYKAFLKNTLKITDKTSKIERPISDRTVINHLVTIRSVFSQAIKSGVTDKKYYPFGSDKIRIKFPESRKVGLTPEEVKAIEAVVIDKDTYHHARNLFLFSFYLAGMRISDVLRLRWSDIQNQRLFYAMGKNDKGGSLKLPEKALTIINEYANQKRSTNDFIFPELKRLSSEQLNDKFIVQRTIAFAASRIDKFLNSFVKESAGIDMGKKLTMHIARHTFGNISGDRIPIQMLQKLYRHSSVVTTISYQSNFLYKEADEALEAVIN